VTTELKAKIRRLLEFWALLAAVLGFATAGWWIERAFGRPWDGVFVGAVLLTIFSDRKSVV
jgi:hypothetical protein